MQPEEYDKMYALEDQHWWFAAKRLFAQVFLKQLSGRKRKILDVGCGTGRNMVMLKEWGQVSGVDVNDLALKYCRRRGLLQVKKESAEYEKKIDELAKEESPFEGVPDFVKKLQRNKARKRIEG